MYKFALFTAAFAWSAGALIFAADAGTQSARVPVLLELFTSEGCSSCPPADRLLETFDQTQPVAGADLIVLSEHVDYWNRLGWKDPFSSPEYSARQQEYTSKFRLDGVYTPQLVVDGRFGLIGSDRSEASATIQKAIAAPKIPIAIANAVRHGDRVTARIQPGAGPSLKGVQAVLYVALADNRAESHVSRGENGGRILTHVAVTRVLEQVGPIDLDGRAAKEVTLMVAPGTGTSGSRLVAFLQDRGSGHILGVAAEKL